ncbi:hypothetical protein Syun_003552 [Stephania yunnanensis]|uniref:Uncharacterized protein n=1 Tax=Stephania yunnanensis TaxID=152371 RepID=A0AAP0L2D4_9MAGN
MALVALLRELVDMDPHEEDGENMLERVVEQCYEERVVEQCYEKRVDGSGLVVVPKRM